MTSEIKRGDIPADVYRKARRIGWRPLLPVAAVFALGISVAVYGEKSSKLYPLVGIFIVFVSCFGLLLLVARSMGGLPTCPYCGWNLMFNADYPHSFTWRSKFSVGRSNNCPKCGRDLSKPFEG